MNRPVAKIGRRLPKHPVPLRAQPKLEAGYSPAWRITFTVVSIVSLAIVVIYA